MSKKIIKDEYVKSDRVKHFGFQVYETVERGEKPKKLDKVGDMEYTPGEIQQEVFSFDEDIEMGRAVIVQDRMIETEKYAPQKFSEEEVIPVNEKREELGEAKEEAEPDIPVITEEQLNSAREEGRQQGIQQGLNQGRTEGRQEAEKRYEAEKNDYIGDLRNTYREVINSMQIFSQAVEQLDENLPDILINMVQDIVGEERKINDDIVASVAKKSLAHLRELERVVFMVHPDDLESMKAEFPDYETQADINVIKGNLRVSTNIGEMNFSIDRMLKEFVERINEEFSPPQEG